MSSPRGRMCDGEGLYCVIIIKTHILWNHSNGPNGFLFHVVILRRKQGHVLALWSFQQLASSSYMQRLFPNHCSLKFTHNKQLCVLPRVVCPAPVLLSLGWSWNKNVNFDLRRISKPRSRRFISERMPATPQHSHAEEQEIVSFHFFSPFCRSPKYRRRIRTLGIHYGLWALFSCVYLHLFLLMGCTDTFKLLLLSVDCALEQLVQMKPLKDTCLLDWFMESELNKWDFST